MLKLVLVNDNNNTHDVLGMIDIEPKDITTNVADGGNTLGGISPELRSKISELILHGWSVNRERYAKSIGVGIPLDLAPRPVGRVHSVGAGRVLQFDPNRTKPSRS